MAIDISQLVKDQLAPVLELDTGIEGSIPRQIEAQMALQGLCLDTMTPGKSVYIALLATKSLIPRLLLTFAQEIKKAKGGEAETEFYDAIEFLKVLQAELEKQIRSAAHEVSPEDVPENPAWPGVGIVGF